MSQQCIIYLLSIKFDFKRTPAALRGGEIKIVGLSFLCIEELRGVFLKGDTVLSDHIKTLSLLHKSLLNMK